jgi:hypothetical protein
MSWLANIFGAGDAQQRGEALDAQLAELNRHDYEPGGRLYEKIKDERGEEAALDAWNGVEDRLEQQAADTADFDASIDREFVAGLGEGRDNVKSFFNNALFQFLKSIPLVVWIGLAVFVFVWLGGLKLLKGSLSR